MRTDGLTTSSAASSPTARSIDAVLPPPAHRPSTNSVAVGDLSATMTRRSLLRRAGIGAATVFVVGNCVVAYRAYDQGVLAEGRGPAFRAWEDVANASGPEALVAAAVLAASAHNTQPWLFAVSDERIDLYADLRRSTGANDALDRELHVSLGCALENLLLAAAAHGYTTAVELLPGPAELVATVTLNPAPAVVTDLSRAIGRRRSNRSEFRPDPVPASALSAMSALADASVAPARVVWLDDVAARRQFGELLIDAATAHVADEGQSIASFAWWRSDWDAIQRHKDGLTIDGVGLRPLVRTIGKILPSTSRKAADKTFLERTRIQARSAAAFGVVVVDDPHSRHDQLSGGRLAQRLHLWASASELGFQHMNQITERIDRDRQLGRPSPFELPLAKLVGSGALTAFRVGTPTVGAIRSPRRPVKEVLK